MEYRKRLRGRRDISRNENVSLERKFSLRNGILFALEIIINSYNN